MRASGARTDARTALRKAAQPGHAPTVYAAVGIAVGYALLEVAYQIGRVADQFPVWGPPEENPGGDQS